MFSSHRQFHHGLPEENMPLLQRIFHRKQVFQDRKHPLDKGKDEKLIFCVGFLVIADIPTYLISLFLSDIRLARRRDTIQLIGGWFAPQIQFRCSCSFFSVAKTLFSLEARIVISTCCCLHDTARRKPC